MGSVKTSLTVEMIVEQIYQGVSPLLPSPVSESEERDIKLGITKVIKNELGLVDTSRKMQIYYEYERHYLELAKEYKDEIKFIHGLQEELRKERSKFFGETLERVFTSLNSAKVSEDAISTWTGELVSAYTSSLNSSEHIVNEKLSGMLGEIRNKMKDTIASVEDPIGDTPQEDIANKHW
jgi:uncharacterized protein YukE